MEKEYSARANHMLIMPDADMDQATDALVGAGYGAKRVKGVWLSVAVPVGEKTADRLVENLYQINP